MPLPGDRLYYVWQNYKTGALECLSVVVKRIGEVYTTFENNDSYRGMTRYHSGALENSPISERSAWERFLREQYSEQERLTARLNRTRQAIETAEQHINN